jgi:hypothetical protein
MYGLSRRGERHLPNSAVPQFVFLGLLRRTAKSGVDRSCQVRVEQLLTSLQITNGFRDCGRDDPVSLDPSTVRFFGSDVGPRFEDWS